MTRTPCCVPFCRRTTATDKLAARGHDEWLCSVHWSAVPARLRRLKATITRRMRRCPTEARARALALLWYRCKRAAIESAGGIS